MKSLKKVMENKHGHIFKEPENNRRWYWMFSERITKNAEPTIHGPFISQNKALKALKTAWLNFLAKEWKTEQKLRDMKT